MEKPSVRPSKRTDVSGFPRVPVLINPSIGRARIHVHRRSIRSPDRYRTASFRGIGLRSLRSNRASEAWELSVRYGRNRQERTAKRACLSFEPTLLAGSYSICRAS